MRPAPVLLLLALCSCTEPDPLYCDVDQPCQTGACLMPQHECSDGVNCATSLNDCNDPACRNDPVCQPLGAQVIGYGTVVTGSGATPLTCAAGSTSVGPNVLSALSPLSTCSGCKCTADCTHQLSIYNTVAECDAGTAALQKVNLDTACQALPGRMSGVFSVAPGPLRCKLDPTAVPSADYSAQRSQVCRPAGLRGNCNTLSCVLVQSQYSACVLYRGDVPCPAALPGRQAGFQTVSDSRGCSCCGQAPPMACAVTVNVYSENLCRLGGNPLPIGMCTSEGLSGSVQLTVNSMPMCAQAGTALQGTLQGTSPLTLCCPQ